MSDTFMPGTTANGGATDVTSLSGAYTISQSDLTKSVVYDGQRTTIGKVLGQYDNLSANQVKALEGQLVQAGLLKAADAGSPLSRADAFNALLRYASFTGEDATTLLSQFQQETPTPGSRSAAGVKVHVDLSNPLDVKQVGDTIAQKLVGRDLTAQEAVDITQSIRSQQVTSAQGELSAEQSMALANTGQGGGAGGVISTEQATSPEAATTQYLTQNDPGDVQAHALLNVFEAIKSKVDTDAQGSGPRAATGPVKVL